jgi:hypothetical protein
MRIKLTENIRKFIETLDESDLTKVTITSDIFASDDESIHDKLMDHRRARLAEIGADIREFNKQLRSEHPEYFE